MRRDHLSFLHIWPIKLSRIELMLKIIGCYCCQIVFPTATGFRSESNVELGNIIFRSQ